MPLGIGRGVRMEIDFQHDTRLFLGHYEVELNRHLRRILKPGMDSFDVGAQHGYDSLVIAKHTHGRVAAFECSPKCLERMKATFSENPTLAPGVEAVGAMVGPELGLDEFAYNGGFIPQFIKIDIDGGEVEALKSATRLLDEHHPALIVETHSPELERDCGNLLVEHGYRPTIVDQRLIWPDRRPVPFNRWLVA